MATQQWRHLAVPDRRPHEIYSFTTRVSLAEPRLHTVMLSFPSQILFEATVKGISQRVLGSASYQVGKLDVLNVSTRLFH